jgi:hypothetical protein
MEEVFLLEEDPAELKNHCASINRNKAYIKTGWNGEFYGTKILTQFH